ncbi:hypothetical protein KR038_010773, partial [Drosophila bunnanda]
ELNLYEYCVKLIAACEKLRDNVENFTESNELNVKQDTIDAALNKYNKFGCFPDGLSLAGLRSYGNLVAKWEKEVHELLLVQNLFSVLEEYKGGLQMKVTLGKMQGWCPLTDDPQDTSATTSSTTSIKESTQQTPTFKPASNNNASVSVENITDSCKVSTDVSRWVHNEINGFLNMSSLIHRFSDIKKLLGDYRNQSCCSYKSIRDRMEIINDGIDILEDLQDLKPSEEKVYLNIESDFRHLNSRLEHLRVFNGTFTSGKCCPTFMDQFKSFQTNFHRNLEDFSPPKSNITLKDLLENVTTLEDICSQQQNQLNKLFKNFDNKRTKMNNNCCVEEANKIYLMENSLNNTQTIKSQQDLSENINSVIEKMAKTNKNLSDTENMLGLEAKEIEKLKIECEKITRLQASKILIKSLSSNVSKLVNKLNENELISTVDMSQLNSNTLQNMNTTFEGINKSIRLNNTEKHKEDVRNLTNTFKNVDLKYSSFHVYHELYQVAATKTFQKYRKHQEDLNESIKAIEASPQGSYRKDVEILKPDINKLEKDLVNLTDNAIPKLVLEIKDRKKEIAGKVEKNDHQESITWFNEEIKGKKQQILERLDKLNQNKADSEKVQQLEAHILQLSDRHASLAKRIADRHEILKQNVNEMSKRIAAASSNALSCHQDCNLDHFPTMDALTKRVKVLEKQVQS